ncbi:MAG TPA: aquaporin [Candidatus Acidoferrales bacterium]|jgi:MIP family channel proteins|nr:aquaporin [Candidatus Acidoferrales bacterium]
MYRIWQKLLAEFIGTFFLVFFSVGAICIDASLRSSGAGSVGLIGIALVRGLTFAILICALVHISGAHFNPAITIGCWVTRKLGSISALFYCVAQILGAIAAARIVAQFVPEQVWRSVLMGTPDLAAGFSRTQGILLEGLLTLFLVFIFFGVVAEAKDSLARSGGFAAGLALFVGMIVGSPYTGASMNPAMALGTAIVAHHWNNHGVYWAGPLLGGVIGAWLYHILFARES